MRGGECAGPPTTIVIRFFSAERLYENPEKDSSV